MKVAAFLLSLSLAAGCDSCKKEETPTATTTKPAAPPSHEPAPPPPGTDADKKRIEALDIAAKIDSGLAGFHHDAKPMAAGVAGEARKAEVWFVDGKPLLPKKLVIAEVDPAGALTSSVDMYFDDKGYLAFVRAPDGLFVFKLEGLALWLDPQQRIKHGIKPEDATARVNELKSDMNAGLTLFKIR